MLPNKAVGNVCGADVRFSRRHRCKIPVTCKELLDAKVKLDLVVQVNDTKGQTIKMAFDEAQLLQEPADVATVSGD